MSHLIEVAFRGNRKEFYLWDGADTPPALRASVVVEADRGEDLGDVHATGELAAVRSAGCPHGCGPTGVPTRKVLRLATADEVARNADVAVQNEQARRKAMERVKANGLVMKLSDAEWQWDRKKLTFYFTADKRVDFRNLVRDLASMFRARIELKQIGVRDEAKRLDGVGRCGRQYCSAAWLTELRPVNLGVAKDQRLSLNPSQISGACGRLMCSLRYEHDFYVQSRKRFPKEGRILVTTLGEEKVVSTDIFRDRVTLRRPDGEARTLQLAELKRELTLGPGGADAMATTVLDAADDALPADVLADDGSASEPAAEDRDVEGVLHGDGRRDARRSSGSSAARASSGARAPGSSSRTARPNGDTTAAPAPPAAPVDQGSWARTRSPLPQVAAEASGSGAVPADATSPAIASAPAPVVEANATPDAAAITYASGTEAVDALPDADSETGGSAEDAERRARRRRGRRGGRRGRGGTRTGEARDGADAASSGEGDDDAPDSPDAASASPDIDAGQGERTP